MSSDVVLSAALRNNLLSLQNTQRLIDTTQLRLATGLKVNSALDNPQNFFTAQALNNRAGDLERLLDGISQSIRTIEEADKGVTALTKLIEQSQSIVQSARDELAASEGEARVVGSVDLSDVADLDAAGFSANIDNGDVIRIITTDDSGVQIAQNIGIATGDTAYSLAARITDTFADVENGEIKASVNDAGNLSIESANGRSFTITTTAANELTLAGFTDLGLGDYFEQSNRTAGGGTNLASTTVVAGNTVSSISLYEAPGDLVEAGDLIGGSTYTDADGNTALALAAGTQIQLTVNSSTGTPSSVAVTGANSFQDFVDSINSAPTLNQLVQAEFDSKTGQIKITSLSDDVENIQLVVTAAGAGETIGWGLGDPSGNLDPVVTAAAGAEDFTVRFNNSTQVLDQLAQDYNTLRSQIDTLVADAQYRGINLLQGDDLVTFFNENNTSRLTTEGAVFTANGLGITEASFRSSAEIELSATQARTALNTVRSFGSTLANNLSIIQTRRDFTEGTITTLKAGADDLTVADQNEEGANLLALQTRQQLGVTSLSLAAQSQQSVLRLF